MGRAGQHFLTNADTFRKCVPSDRSVLMLFVPFFFGPSLVSRQKKHRQKVQEQPEIPVFRLSFCAPLLAGLDERQKQVYEDLAARAARNLLASWSLQRALLNPSIVQRLRYRCGEST